MKKIQRIVIIFLSVYALNVCTPSFGMEQQDKNKTGHKRKRGTQRVAEEEANKKRKLDIGDAKVERIKKKEPVECLFGCDVVPAEEEKKLRCQHIFHEKCIQKYFQENDNRCPVCRKTEFCWGCKKKFIQDDFIKDDQGVARNVRKRPRGDEILEKCEHEFHKDCLTDEYCKECPVPVCVQKVQEHRENDEGEQQGNSTVTSESFSITLYENHQADVFLRNPRRSYHFTISLLPNIDDFDIYRDRFFIVEYKGGSNIKECDIFDFHTYERYTKLLQNKSIESLDVCADRFFIVEYEGDGIKKEVDIFDLQEDTRYTKKVQNKNLEFLDVRADRFLIVEYEGDGIKKEVDIFDLQKDMQYTKQVQNKTVASLDVRANRFLLVEYEADSNIKECDIFDLPGNKSHTRRLQQKEVCDLTILAGRFFIVEYKFDGNSKECDIFDLQESKPYIKQLQNKAIKAWRTLIDRFFIVEYEGDGDTKDVDIFDLQKNKQYTKQVWNRHIHWQIKQERFLVAEWAYYIRQTGRHPFKEREYKVFDLLEDVQSGGALPQQRIEKWDILANRFLLVVYVVDGIKRKYNIFDLQGDKQYIRELSVQNIEEWDILANRFFVIVNGDKKECVICDLQEDKQYSKPIQNKSIEFWDIKENNFLIVIYAFDEKEKSREVDIFDLQKNRQYTKTSTVQFILEYAITKVNEENIYFVLRDNVGAHGAYHIFHLQTDKCYRSEGGDGDGAKSIVYYLYYNDYLDG